MKKNKECFIKYLKKLDLHTDDIEIAFEAYFVGLVETNQYINLFSRKMDVDEIWSKHSLDSVSIYELYRDWSGKMVLDFGSGGGLPGMPIKIITPECDMTLLDSTKKKIEAVRKVINNSLLPNVNFLSCRLEELKIEDAYDIIVSRAVTITPAIQKAMIKILKKNGKIFLYKSEAFEDAKLFRDFRVHNVLEVSNFRELELNCLGERRVIEINYG